MARVIPFPASHRLRLVQTAAETMLRRNGLAEFYLQKRLTAHAKILGRKGVSPTEIAVDVGCYERAVRAAFAQTLLGKGGAE